MFQVEPKTEDCVHEDLKAGSEVDAQLLVTRGGKLDVRFRIENPYKAVLYEQLLFSNIDDRTGQVLSTIVKKGYKFIAQVDGTYAFCFDNKMSRWTAKVIDFDITVNDKVVAGGGASEKDEAGKPAEVSVMMSSVTALGESMEKISTQQKYHRQREFMNRD
ncbi:empB, partial [Symbiodinium sp. KB8]